MGRGWWPLVYVGKLWVRGAWPDLFLLELAWKVGGDPWQMEWSLLFLGLGGMTKVSVMYKSGVESYYT